MTTVSLSPEDLGQTLTFITNFMCDPSKSYKTYDELLAIYHSCKDKWAGCDVSDDLRITGFINDMKDGTWIEPNIVIVRAVVGDRALVVDGIHRGIAYLDCFKEGVLPKDLPPLFLGY